MKEPLQKPDAILARRVMAMTLVELCVSLAIAAGVVTAALSTTAATVRQGRVMAGLYGAAADNEQLRRAMAMDFLHARSIGSVSTGEGPGGLRLQTTWSLDDADRPRRLATQIDYVVKTIGGVRWLCRLEKLSGGRRRLRLVASGIDSITLEQETQREDDQTQEQAPNPKDAATVCIVREGRRSLLRLETGGL